jgi:hypothetical protein
VRHALFAVSGDTAGSDWSESMAVGLSDPLGLCGATDPASTAAYFDSPPGGPSCRLPTTTSSPVTDEMAGRGADPAPGAGRLLACSDKPPELTSSLALRVLDAKKLEGVATTPDRQRCLLHLTRLKSQPQLLEEGRGNL